MKHVRIAELKAKLSEYLRVVRGGETITVMDRDTAIATITPVQERPQLTIHEPPPGTPAFRDIPLLGPSTFTIDVVELLLEDRNSGR